MGGHSASLLARVWSIAPGPAATGTNTNLFTLAERFAVPLPKWEWAEVDGPRLVWAEDGALHSGRVNESGLCKITLLADFNAMEFEAIAAPY